MPIVYLDTPLDLEKTLNILPCVSHKYICDKKFTVDHIQTGDVFLWHHAQDWDIEGWDNVMLLCLRLQIV